MILFKVVFLRDSGVGKNNLLWHFNHKFNLGEQAHIGMEFTTCSIQVDSKTIKMQTGDPAGQALYIITSAYRHGAAGVLLRSIANHLMHENMECKVKGLQGHVNSNTVITLLGDKSNRHPLRAMPTDEVPAFTERKI